MSSSTTPAFRKAVKAESKLRLALIGPSGSGKTFTGLTFAKVLSKKRIAVIDTERGSAAKYADLFDFDTLELARHSPDDYCAAIESAVGAGYDVLFIDSLSHAWMGRGGALEQVDQESARSKSHNNFAAWRTVTPMHNRLVDAMVSAPLHVIASMRSKTEWVVDKNEQGKSVPRKIGTAAVQREGLEFEFDVVADMEPERNTFVVTKSRCPDLSGAVVERPGPEVAEQLLRWLAGVVTPFGRVVNAIMAARTMAELDAAGKLASGLDEANRNRLKPIYASRRDRIQANAAIAAASIELGGTKQPAGATTEPPGDAQAPADDESTEPEPDTTVAAGEPGLDVDELDALVPRQVIVRDTHAELPDPIAGMIAFAAENEPDRRWLVADGHGMWRFARSAQDRAVVRATAESLFVERGWSDLGKNGAMDLDAGGQRLRQERNEVVGGQADAAAGAAADEQQPLPEAPKTAKGKGGGKKQPPALKAATPAAAPSKSATTTAPPLSQDLKAVAMRADLQGLIGEIEDAGGNHRRIFLQTQLAGAFTGAAGDLLFCQSFDAERDEGGEIFEWHIDQWIARDHMDRQLRGAVRMALSRDVSKRALACRLDQDKLLALLHRRTGETAKGLRELTERSLVLLRAALGELQEQQQKGGQKK